MAGLENLRLPARIVRQFRTGADERRIRLDQQFALTEFGFGDINSLKFNLVLSSYDDLFDLHILAPSWSGWKADDPCGCIAAARKAFA